jgi:hypothetical protein
MMEGYGSVQIMMDSGLEGPKTNVPDPDPNPDPHVFGPSRSGSFYYQAKMVRKILIPTIKQKW